MTNKAANQAADKLFDAIGDLAGLYFRVVFLALKKLNFKDFHLWWWGICGTGIIFGLTYTHRFAFMLRWIFPQFVTERALGRVTDVPWDVWFWLFEIGSIMALVPALGIGEFGRLRRYQRGFDILALKAGSGIRPKVVEVSKLDEYRTRITVQSLGVGIDKYRTKEGDLTSALGETIEKIKLCDDPKNISLTLTRGSIPKKVAFGDTPETKAPLGFCVGKSVGGWVSESLSDLPHMMIAGTTGGGKSVFFKQMLLSLLKSTPYVQLYLIDLKKGVEMGAFGELPNVRIATTEREAVTLLEELKIEMERRFSLLEKTGKKDIESSGEKLDKIVVGIDEASVLYAKTRSKSKRELMERARELTDDLAKLSRAAGMHIILATQKVSKETIDTKVQENIGGRLCFKMATLQGSMTVLGNKKAMALPDIKGRGIWSRGNQFVEVQAPFLSEEELSDQLEALAGEYERGKRQLYNPMLDASPTKPGSKALKKTRTRKKGGEK